MGTEGPGAAPGKLTVGAGGVHDWNVGGAVIEGPEGILLVRNARPDGSVDWSPPGGVIDEGEHLLEGLAREVLEETGLVVTEWQGPLYAVEATAPDMGWRMQAEIHLGVAYEGDLVVDDPDGIVTGADFCPVGECAERLAQGHPWVREPLLAWLADRWIRPRRFAYVLDGARRGEWRVRRV